MADVSIIVTHWAMSEVRSETMRGSIDSLIETAPDAEIIVIDNGGSHADSEFLLELNETGKIATYIRNRKNLSFWFARNQGLKLCSGEYIVIADNDIFFKPGWMEGCQGFLERHRGKYLATPIACDPMNAVRKVRWTGEEIEGWRCNYRAGSNVFMMRRSDFNVIGYFDQHRISGSKYVDTYNRLGYSMAIMPEPRAIDMGLRQGYNLNDDLPHTEL